MSADKWWYKEVDAKLLSDLAIFSILSSDIQLYFHNSMQVVPLKYLTFFLVGINTKQFRNIPKEKYFAPFRILNSFIKCFVNLFVDITLIFFDNSFSSFLFVHFYSFSLSKPVFFTNLLISLLLAKFACFSLAAKLYEVTLSNSWVVIHLLWSWSVVVSFSISLIFVL